MAEEEQESKDFFVCIQNPKNLRRNLLESSKSTLSILKQVYTVKQIREAKHEVMDSVINELRELKILVQKTDDLMPKHTREELKKLVPEIEIKKKSASKREKFSLKDKEELAQQLQAQPGSDMDKLTRALSDIEKKLQNL
jgi:inorganic triphosphatase YgiF